MKRNRAGRKTDYSKIYRKLYSYIFFAAMGAIVFVVALWQFVQRQRVFGDWVVGFLESALRMEHTDAMRVYQVAIRSNMEIILCVAVALCFFLLCRVILSLFVRYFDEVNAGIDMLIEDEGGQIELSAEMDFMERKLNALRQTLEKRQQDAKLAEQRKTDLVMYLAHDIKTPLTSVIGYLNLLEEAPDMPPEQKAKYVAITLEKAYRLERLVGEFFEIARYNLQAIELNWQRIDLAYMLAQMADEFYPTLSANGKRAQVHAPEDLTVYGDPDKLARVLINIFKNAVAYSEDNSAIEIRAEASDDGVSIVFTNAGQIPRDKLDCIFDKFYRLDASRSSDTGGAGLGLAIAKEIVALHGGQIHAESEGGFTRFTVRLPLGPEGACSNGGK